MTIPARAIGLALAILLEAPAADARQPAPEFPSPVLPVAPCADFELDGSGRAAAWQTTDWTTLNRRAPGALDYTARVKLRYSTTGLYVLFEGTDRRLSATLKADFSNLWTEDVFELFLWPDQRFPLYFEYEISPLGVELPLLIPNIDGDVHGWRPWRDEPRRRIRKAVTVSGPQQPGASIEGWRAEIFLPFDVLRPLANRTPKPGTRWRANFYRIDYDTEPPTQWDWARVGPSFHEFHKFGTLVFQ